MSLLRPLEGHDLSAVLALNAAEEVKLAPLDRARLDELVVVADRFDVIESDGAFAGFVVTMTPEADYDSENFRWFRERYADRFYYLDRIVLDASMRRRGLASRVYDVVEATAATYDRLALEVNLVPSNPGSLAFHTARGYAEVGRLGDENHLVTMMTKELRTP